MPLSRQELNAVHFPTGLEGPKSEARTCLFYSLDGVGKDGNVRAFKGLVVAAVGGVRCQRLCISLHHISG